MTRAQQRTTLSAKLRLQLLERAGHQLAITSSTQHATVTVKRADGRDHTITITPDDVPPKRRNGEAFKRYPQSTLIALAIHAGCDWNDDTDWNNKLLAALAVDPSNCVCVLCCQGQHIPLERALPVNVAAILLGDQRNNTGCDVEINIEYVADREHGLDLSQPPSSVEARILDTGNATYRRYNIEQWWQQIVQRRKGN